MTTEPREQQEPSMEEILSSIRRIIADEEAEDDGSGADDELGAAEAHAVAVATDDDDLDDDEGDDVLELTKVVRDSGEVVDLNADAAAESPATEAAPEPEFEPTVAAADEPTFEPPAALADEEPAIDDDDDELELAPVTETVDEQPPEAAYAEPNQEDDSTVHSQITETPADLVSASVASAATGSFAKLTEMFHQTPADESIADGSGRSMEQFVEDMMRPMLKGWLDDNLPPIVEKLVQKEIQKIARRAEID